MRLSFKRLRTRLTLAFAGMFAVVLAVVAVSGQIAISRTAETSVTRDLNSGVTVFQRLWMLREENLRRAARLLALDYGFRAAAATGDVATTESALQNLRARVGIPSAFLLLLDGSVIGLPPADARSVSHLTDELDAGRSEGILRIGGGLYQAVAVPVRAPALIGWTVFAARLDAGEMQSLSSLSAIPLEASVLRREDRGTWRSGGAPMPPALARHLEGLSERSAGTLTFDEPGGRTIARMEPLAGFERGHPALLVLQYPLEAELAVYRPLQHLLWGIGVLSLIAVGIGTSQLSKSITRPIFLLDAAARRMAAGDPVRVDIATGDEIERLAGSFNHMVTAIDERERQISHMAFHDVLTGLPNRALLRTQLDQQLRRALARETSVAVLRLNVDDHKAITDALGHGVGDAVVTRVATELSTLAGQGVVARIGGNEFAILLECEGRHALEMLAGALIDRLSPQVSVAGHMVSIAATIGIAIAPGDGTDPTEILRNADLALGRARLEGRGTFRYFESGMDAVAQARRAIEVDLRVALQEGGLELHYQPLFDLACNRVTSFEALVRWRHPTRGMISPVEFIPVAEETGLIVQLGAWVIRQAAREAAQWPDPIRVAVNVSAIQFQHPGLLATLVEALAHSGLAPSRLEVEITESIFIADSAATLETLHSLRRLGVRIALDDFGTGFSSLAYLRSFPFDKIKIDRSFITDLTREPQNIAIVRAITHLAQAMGMETTAEGVEDADQLEALRLEGCTNVQGFLFSRPVPADQVAGLIGMDRAPAARAA